MPTPLTQSLSETHLSTSTYLQDHSFLPRLLHPYTFPIFQYGRTSGLTRFLVDSATSLGYKPFFALTLGPRSISEQSVEVIKYGSETRQKILLSTSESYHSTRTPTSTKLSKIICFIHGGAWGSGSPSFYIPLISKYNELGYDVALIGYRTFPSGVVGSQVSDIHSAYLTLLKKYNEDDIILTGHSSGSHITLLTILRHNLKTTFIGLAGVYNMHQHFVYESKRGLEVLSGLQAAGGYTEENIRLNDLENNLFTVNESKFIFVHGFEDTTVPFTQTVFASKLLEGWGCDVRCIYLEKVDHMKVVFEFMKGKGVEWLEVSRCIKSKI